MGQVAMQKPQLMQSSPIMTSECRSITMQSGGQTPRQALHKSQISGSTSTGGLALISGLALNFMIYIKCVNIMNVIFKLKQFREFFEGVSYLLAQLDSRP